MIYFEELQPGTIVKVTEYDGIECNAIARVRTAENDEEWASITVVTGEFPALDGSLWLGDEDKWKIIPLDKIPDTVMAKIAQMVLVGDA